ncbi:MAG TPA: hypothetical protein VL981_03055 [Candidatus Methylacidiphilales bacterium]|nr:hypothetical protein [Candidatus Methylacidiphilales bacterium]
MRRAALCMVLAAFAFSCGGQWYALQCVAWAGMLYDYSQTVPFPVALEMTFSGQYPCAICKEIAEKKQAEKEKVLVMATDKQKILAKETEVAGACFAPTPADYPVLRQELILHSEPPPLPPPRFT